MHEVIARLVQEDPEKNRVPNMARDFHHLHSISSRSPMLVKHHPSHLTKGTIFSSQLHHSEKPHREKRTDVRDPNHDKRFRNESF
jgi:hypothetical protein